MARKIRSINSFDEMIQFLEYKEKLRPCDDYEISSFELKCNITLPLIYKKFLLTLGKSAGDYMMGSSAFFDDLPLWESTKELIEENNLPPLPPDAFPFWMHQGYMAAYFKVTEGDDPPVYLYTEGKENKEFVLDTKTLTGFFLIELRSSYSEDEFIFPDHLV